MRRPTTLVATVPTTKITTMAVRKPRPGMRRPNSRSYPGEKKASMASQNTYRSHEVAMTGTVTKKPVRNRTLNQLRKVPDMAVR